MEIKHQVFSEMGSFDEKSFFLYKQNPSYKKYQRALS
jgi:hypothetical protein